jgi:hypothetical protein
LIAGDEAVDLTRHGHEQIGEHEPHDQHRAEQTHQREHPPIETRPARTLAASAQLGYRAPTVSPGGGSSRAGHFLQGVKGSRGKGKGYSLTRAANFGLATPTLAP